MESILAEGKNVIKETVSFFIDIIIVAVIKNCKDNLNVFYTSP